MRKHKATLVGVTADDGTRADLEAEFCEAWDDYKQAMKKFAEQLYDAYRWHKLTLDDVCY